MQLRVDVEGEQGGAHDLFHGGVALSIVRLQSLPLREQSDGPIVLDHHQPGDARLLQTLGGERHRLLGSDGEYRRRHPLGDRALHALVVNREHQVLRAEDARELSGLLDEDAVETALDHLLRGDRDGVLGTQLDHLGAHSSRNRHLRKRQQSRLSSASGLAAPDANQIRHRDDAHEIVVPFHDREARDGQAVEAPLRLSEIVIWPDGVDR